MPEPAELPDVIRPQTPPVDREIAALALSQHGVVALPQLVALGLSARAVRHRVARGALHCVHRGVYAVGYRRLTARGRWMAAVLAGGPEALLSHRDAAALWGLRQTARASVDVTIPGHSRSNRAGIEVHRARELHPEDRTTREGIPLTSVARTLLDLAEVVPYRELERAVEQAERLRLFDLQAVDLLLERSRGRRGRHALSSSLADFRPETLATRSELERRFLDLCRDFDLPRPAVNAVVEGFDVDASWADRRLVVELDSVAFHLNRHAFERDRERDVALQLASYRVVRITDRRLKRRPRDVAQELRTLLGAQLP